MQTDPFAPRPRIAAALWDAAWSQRGRTGLAFALMVLAKTTAVFVPLLLKAIVDRFSRPENLTEPVAEAASAPGAPLLVVLPVFLLIAYALMRFAGTLFGELRDVVFAPVIRRTVTGFSQRAYAHLLALPPRFHGQRSTGSLIRDVERGTGGIGFLLGAGLFTAVPTLVEFFAILVVMAAGYSLWFTLAIMVTFFAYGALTLLLMRKRELRQRRVNEMDSQANARMVDGLLNYETVKAYARESFERERYAEVCAQWVAGSIVNQHALSTLHIAQSAVIAAGVAAVMLLAGQQTVGGTMTVGDLVLVNAYVIQICLPLNALGFLFREARDALVNTENLLALLGERNDIDDRPDAQPLRLTGGTVSFEHVSFGYEPARQILYDVSLEIPAGQTLAVVGGSGSGKSTLARLLMRFYEVNAGRVLIDGQDLRGLRLASLREAIGVVAQDTSLFNQTIAYNIGYGRIGAGMADIIAAAQAAQVHEFILSLPQQYETVVGERGMKLSGGEKQRIAIARAFLKNPPIMIFDEATSALDTRAERAIQGELDRIAAGRTTLIIAHRLSTIVNADQIIVMDKGRIVERGRHAELLAAGGLYAQLWNLQLQQQQFERLERRLARQPVNLAVLAALSLDGLRGELARRRIDLYTDIDADSASVTGDPSTLSDLLNELLRDALQATPSGGRIELRLARHERAVRLSVTDGRHAMAGAPPPRDDDAPPVDPLALRSTVERQGGSYEVEPPGSTRGMTHRIELPLRALGVVESGAAAAAPPAAAMALPPRPLAGLRILCVDDDADALDSLRLLLEADGAAVDALSSGRAALAWCEARPSADWPQLLVCDIVLGDEDGHAVMRSLRQLEARRGIALAERLPAVALTGLAQPDDRVRALMAGFQAHLGKPVDPRQLVSTLYKLAGRASADAGGDAAAPAATG